MTWSFFFRFRQNRFFFVFASILFSFSATFFFRFRSPFYFRFRHSRFFSVFAARGGGGGGGAGGQRFATFPGLLTLSHRFRIVFVSFSYRFRTALPFSPPGLPTFSHRFVFVFVHRFFPFSGNVLFPFVFRFRNVFVEIGLPVKTEKKLSQRLQR